MFVKFLVILFLFPYLISSEPIQLTDKTWGNMLKGQWMVEFFAPWCGACKQFKPVWNDFSTAMQSKNIKVAAVDVEQYPALSGRFRISALPTIYHVNDGVFRQYSGDRSLNGLKRYIENQDWKNTEPLSTYFGPNSILMSFASSLFDVSVIVKEGHALLQEYYGWPSWVIYTIFAVGVVIIGIFLGFGFLQLLDYCLGSSSNENTEPVPEDVDELDEDASQKLTDSKKEEVDEGIKSVSSDEEDEEDEEEEEEEEEKPITTDQTVRQRHSKK